MNWLTFSKPLEYASAYDFMQQIADLVIRDQYPESIFLLEHLEVYTIGRSGDIKDILLPSNISENIKHNPANDIPIIEVDRGGKVTYHGPGQRIVYLILKLKNYFSDIRSYVSFLEQWIINVLKFVGVYGFKIDGIVGVWVKYKGLDAKIGSIGIKVRNSVTYHGLAINVATNMNQFLGLIPCGISDCPMVSLSELGINISYQEFDSILKNEFFKLL